MKLIFVTGWVISWLGKWITGSSIGMLLKSAWYSVGMMKLDPYLQIDAWTMSPYEHGEVFVTHDGGETDLDFWHYERFIDEDLPKKSSVTTGQIYYSVISKERQGEYLWQTVQVIPHIIDEIKWRIKELAAEKDVMIIEIWGTVGDIEGPHFFEAMRQLRYDLGRNNVMFVHVVPLLYLSHSGEIKTKAIQHSVMKLRELGIQPHMLVCRSPKPIAPEIKKKLALFCDIDPSYMIEALDQKSIYQVPRAFAEQNIAGIIEQHFGIEEKKADVKQRNELVDRMLYAEKTVHIAMAGKYTQLDDCYLSVLEALKHAAAHLWHGIQIHRINTEEYESDGREDRLQEFVHHNKIQGILVPGGFGKRGVEGMIRVADYARRKNIPYFGICLGLQVAVISYARNVLWLSQANSMEFDETWPDCVVALMDAQKNIVAKWGTMRLWSYEAHLHKESLAAKLYNQTTVRDRHRHRYEVNPAYHDRLRDAGLVLSGFSPDGRLVEYIELKDHPFYLATQAHPEFTSRLTKPQALFVGFVKASIENVL